MQRARYIVLIACVAALAGVGQMLGCAPQARPEAPAAPAAAQETPAGIDELLQQAEDAYANEHYEQARTLLELLKQNSDQLSAQQRELVEERSRRIDSILHERRVAAERPAAHPPAEEQVTEPEAPTTGQIEQAPEAGKKAEQAAAVVTAKGEPLTEPQQKPRDVPLRGVEAAESRQRKVGREQSEKLLAMSEQYETAGEFAKAIDILSLVQQAPPVLAPEQLRAQASDRLEVVAHQAKEQKREADRIISMFQKPRRLLEKGNVQPARQTYEEVMEEARMANLSAEPATSVFTEAQEFLQQDFAAALRRAAPDYAQKAREMLETARDNLAASLSRKYLDAGNPEDAEPYLRRLAERASGETAAWAQQKLEELDRIKERVRQERLQQVADQIRRAYGLAREFTALAQQGRAEAAARVGRQLADARVELAARKARLALERGAWKEADQLLAGAPAAAAAAAVVEKSIAPVRQRLQRTASAAQNLQTAEQAIVDGDFEKASGLLETAWQYRPLPEWLTLKLETLAGVLEPIRQARAREMELRSWRRTALEKVQTELARLKQREQGWEDYHAALRDVMTGNLEEARKKLSGLLSEPAGLLEAEVVNARGVLGALAEDPAAARAEARKALGRARELYKAGRYMAAGEALNGLRGMEGFSLEREIRRETDKLAGKIQAAEQRAEELYREAAAAHENGKVNRLKELLEELKSKYSGTRAFQKRR